MPKYNENVGDDKLLKKGFSDRNPKKLKIKKVEADEMVMKKPPKESSNISEIGYRASKQLLRIKFKNKTSSGSLIEGSIYDYKGVTPELYNDMMNAESIGKFFYAHIRNNPDIIVKQLK